MDKFKAFLASATKVYYVGHDWVLDHKKISGAIVLVIVGVVLGKLL